MKVRFNGPEPESRVFGRTFPIGEAVEVGDMSEDVQTKLDQNPTFARIIPRPRKQDTE